MQDTRRLTELQARALLREWQDESKLRDWTILLEIRSSIELKDIGDVNVTEEKRCAYIRMMDHRDHACQEEMEPYDMETTLVHEMLHVAFAPFSNCEKGSHQHMIQEQSIDAIAKLLVGMKRELRSLRSRAHRKRVA
jgi:hypothetical protein